MIILKTGYEWCLEGNIRVLDIADWETDWAFYEQSYYEEKIDVTEFYRRIALCKVKANSTPRKTDMYLEYRMYGLVPYNLSPIQQGIQFGHAVVEYQQNVIDIKPCVDIYNKWAKKVKTPLSIKVLTELEERNEANYHKWVEKIGGQKNVFLREYLKNFRLA